MDPFFTVAKAVEHAAPGLPKELRRELWRGLADAWPTETRGPGRELEADRKAAELVRDHGATVADVARGWDISEDAARKRIRRGEHPPAWATITEDEAGLYEVSEDEASWRLKIVPPPDRTSHRRRQQTAERQFLNAIECATSTLIVIAARAIGDDFREIYVAMEEFLAEMCGADLTPDTRPHLRAISHVLVDGGVEVMRAYEQFRGALTARERA